MVTEARTVTALGAVAMIWDGGIFGKRGILELRDGRLTFRTTKGTHFDVPAEEVRDVTIPARSWTGANPNALLRCTIAGKRRLIALQYVLPGPVPDDGVKKVLADAVKWARPNMKLVFARVGLRLFGLGVGSVIKIVEAVEITEIPDHLLFPEHEVPRELLRLQPAAVWRHALTGESISSGLLPTFWQRHAFVSGFWGAAALGIVMRELVHGGVELFPSGVVMAVVILVAIALLVNVRRSRVWFTHYLARDYLIQASQELPRDSGCFRRSHEVRSWHLWVLLCSSSVFFCPPSRRPMQPTSSSRNTRVRA